jgi:hypothetical protein
MARALAALDWSDAMFEPTVEFAESAAPGGASSPRVFKNCDEARGAGVTPIRRGTPQYAANTRLDGDKDGIACEERRSA